MIIHLKIMKGVYIMIHVTRMGENSVHDETFFVDRPQGHPVYLLLLVKTRARFFVGDAWQETPKHTAILFEPGQKHLYGPLSGTEEKPAYINSWIRMSSSTPILSEHFPYGKPVFLHNPEEFYTLFHTINNEFYGAAPHKNRVIHYLLSALLDKIADESDIREYPPLYYPLVSLREKIYAFPQQNWNVPAMAKELGISAGYLHVIYKHFFGVTCIGDVVRSRIQTACELLSSTNRTVEEIAQLCGYRYTEHFVRQFKARMGITPAKYRKCGG